MARKPRYIVPGIPQHVIQRGHNRSPCFFAKEDYQRYLEYLHDAASQNQAAVHAYVLMTNHVHILVTPGHPNSITHMMQDLGRKYVRYINNQYKRSGTLWEGRYKAGLVDSEAYLLTCMRYIEMNPVRAKMIDHPGEYRWSSYLSNAQGNDELIIQPHPLYLQLGDDKAQRQHAYRELFKAHINKEVLHEIREALNQELIVGRDDFKDKIEKMTKRQSRPGNSGRPRIEEQSEIYYVF